MAAFVPSLLANFAKMMSANVLRSPALGGSKASNVFISPESICYMHDLSIIVLVAGKEASRIHPRRLLAPRRRSSLLLRPRPRFPLAILVGKSFLESWVHPDRHLVTPVRLAEILRVQRYA